MANVKHIFSIPMVFVCLTLLTASPGWAAFTLLAEANPDPVSPGQMLDVQISVSTTNASGALSLRVSWPDELNSSPVITGGGACTPNCSSGGSIVWDLGVLAASASVTVSFTEIVRSTVDDDTQIPLSIELLEGQISQESIALSVEVLTQSPLELAVDPLSDPVASAEVLVYEIIYGNASIASAENSVLSFPIPAGTQFQSATNGGVHDSGSVSWNIGSLAPNSGGREWVTLQVDALDDGTLLLIDAATLKSDINFQPAEARAMAVSRVGDETLELSLEVNPDPVDPNQVLGSQITVSNPQGSPTGMLSLRVLWPEELNTSPYVTGGGKCTPNCTPGGYLIWDLGVLGPATSASVSFNENVRSATIDGTLIPMEVELIEAGEPARNISHTVVTRTNSSLELTVDAHRRPRRVRVDSQDCSDTLAERRKLRASEGQEVRVPRLRFNQELLIVKRV